MNIFKYALIGGLLVFLVMFFFLFQRAKNFEKMNQAKPELKMLCTIVQAALYSQDSAVRQNPDAFFIREITAQKLDTFISNHGITVDTSQWHLSPHTAPPLLDGELYGYPFTFTREELKP